MCKLADVKLKIRSKRINHQILQRAIEGKFMIGQDEKDPISSIKLSKVILPLPNPISDAKVITGRQRPLTCVALLVTQIYTHQGHEGLGFSYSLRTGGEAQFAHAAEIGELILGEDPNDIQRIWKKMMWESASSGQSGLSAQTIASFDIALWDLKAKRAGLSIAKFIGAYWQSVPCYNTSGGYLQAPVEEIIDKAEQSLERGIKGIKVKIGQPDFKKDYKRLAALRKHIGPDVPIMVDVNQQWERQYALSYCRRLEEFDLVWIEEPLDAYDYEGHARLTAALDTPIATGEMLSSSREHFDLIDKNGAVFIQPDAPRIGGITPFLEVAGRASQARLGMAPHFVMEIHIHLAACYPTEPWVEHFEWLEPLFNERLSISDGRMWVPDRPGLGFTLAEQVAHWTEDSLELRAGK